MDAISASHNIPMYLRLCGLVVLPIPVFHFRKGSVSQEALVAIATTQFPVHFIKCAVYQSLLVDAERRPAHGRDEGRIGILWRGGGVVRKSLKKAGFKSWFLKASPRLVAL